MASPRHEPLLRVSCFEVLIGDREIGFASVGPISSETAIDEPRDVGFDRYATVVLRRALGTSTELYDWRRGIVDGKEDRRDVTIRLLSGPGGSVVSAWRLARAWPIRWSGPALDALRNDVAFEELELTFDDLAWLAPEPTTTGG